MGNSSSTASSSTTNGEQTNGEQYDVFLSFRGEDTRDSFTSHLYKALDEKQIKTFIDNQLVRGEEITAGLLSVIRESKISVVIFSENYASSKWCLHELAEIMKYEEMNEKIVIPVFYHVNPSHVRKQIGSYEAAFAKHDQNELEEEVQKWREALIRASTISGWDSSVARNEAEFVCNIVRDVWNKLNNIWPSCDFEDLVKDLVGIDKCIERVVSLLCLGVSDFRIIGIWGMGGMGKTTIADAVFHLVSHQFEKTHFALCVRAESEKGRSGLIRLRDEIISKVLNEKDLKIDSLSIPQSIKRRLNQKKVLIVLDDVDKLTKLEILAGGLDRFGPGSRIILTTRDKQVLRNWGGDDHNMYKVEGLNHDEALQLFCNYAFKQNHPTEDLEVLSREVVKIAKDVPLVVKVLGSSMYKKSKRDWENAVDKFQRIFNPDVLDVLKISYDGLDEEEKGLFLDLACFDEPRKEGDFGPNLLSDREFSLRGLIDKSLVTVDHGFYKMHDLLREMGREIVDKESPNKPGDRSRLWREEDVLHTLMHNDGTDAVQGIFLNMFELKDVHLISQAFEKMYNLRTLITTYGDCDEDFDEDYDEVYDGDCDEDYDELHLCNGDLDYLPDELRYLHWKRYHLEMLPSVFNPVNLVELDLCHSNIKQLWEGRTCVPKLKRLNLSCCRNLIRIPDLSDIPSAESINLESCISLLEIHSSRERPKNLHSLKLSGCENLSRFPSNIHIEGSEFSLCGCISLTKFPHISGNIKWLDLSESGVEEVPSTIQSLSQLEGLIMINCTRLKRISNSICNLKSLDRIDLTGCCKLESFPDILGGMELKYLNLSGTAIKELPPSIGNLNRLEELVLSDCKNLETFPHISGNIKRLDLSWSGVEEVPSTIESLSQLEGLIMANCTRLKRISKSICKLKSLDRLDLRGCCKLESFPDILEGMELKYLNLSGTAIKELTLSFGNLNRLEELVLSDYISKLNLYGRSKLEKLPPLSGLCSLKELRLNNSNLTEISEDIGCLSLLEKLELHGNVFERLPKSIKQLSKLYYLSLYNCGMLRSLPELPSSLRYLEAMNCKQLIQSLPDESEIELCADGGGSFIFNFMNCLKLNQKAVSNLFRDSLLKMQHMGTEQIISLFKVSAPPLPPSPFCSIAPPDEEVKVGICLPGGEIPEWFSYKNSGSSINIRGLRNDCSRSSYIMGFAVCLVIGFEGYNVDFDHGCFDVRYCFHTETGDGHKKGFFSAGFQILPFPHTELIGSDHIVRNDFFTTLLPGSHRDGPKEGFFHYSIAPFMIRPDEHNELIGSDHILLGYNLSRKCYEFFQELDTLLANRGMTDYTGTSFQFNLEQVYYSSNGAKAFEVKHCGIQPIYVPALLMDSVAINQDTKDTSGSDDTEETCESHPKRICTNANQCS